MQERGQVRDAAPTPWRLGPTDLIIRHSDGGEVFEVDDIGTYTDWWWKPEVKLDVARRIVAAVNATDQIGVEALEQLVREGKTLEVAIRASIEEEG
jgi:hypothetical protein